MLIDLMSTLNFKDFFYKIIFLPAKTKSRSLIMYSVIVGLRYGTKADQSKMTELMT